MSETSRIRELVLPYLVGDGCDLGYGGDAICPTAIAIDLPDKYCNWNKSPQHLHGDCTHLHWFKDNCLDYLYSSHLLEDFQNPKEILIEWIRVIKPGGIIALNLPHEKRFKEHCQASGQPYNNHHKCEEMSLDYMRNIFKELGLIIVFEKDEVSYCFVIIGKKM